MTPFKQDHATLYLILIVCGALSIAGLWLAIEVLKFIALLKWVFA